MCLVGRHIHLFAKYDDRYISVNPKLPAISTITVFSLWFLVAPLLWVPTLNAFNTCVALPCQLMHPKNISDSSIFQDVKPVNRQWPWIPAWDDFSLGISTTSSKDMTGKQTVIVAAFHWLISSQKAVASPGFFWQMLIIVDPGTPLKTLLCVSDRWNHSGPGKVSLVFHLLQSPDRPLKLLAQFVLPATRPTKRGRCK